MKQAAERWAAYKEPRRNLLAQLARFELTPAQVERIANPDKRAECGISGTDAVNYTQNTSATTTADITAKSLAVTITASNKVYNASDVASVTYADNRIAGDSFTVSGTSTFSDKNTRHYRGSSTCNGIV